jgi:dipeptidyl aminopeptidase/acylaminoacyl peptidase
MIYLWAGYEGPPLKPRLGEPVLVLRSTQSDIEKRWPAGAVREGASALQMSASGRWIGYLEVSSTPALVLVEIPSGTRKRIERVSEFFFAGEGEEYLLTKGLASAKSESAFQLSVHKLDTDRAWLSMPRTRAFALSPEHARLAWVSPQGLKVCDFSMNAVHVIDATPGARFDALSWSPSGRALAFLRTDNRGNQALITASQLHTNAAVTKSVAVADLRSFPTGHEIAPSIEPDPFAEARDGAPIEWRADEQGVFVSIRTIEPTPASAADSATVPDLVLWHWQDERLPSRKAFEAKYKARPTWLGFVSLTERTFLRLEGAEMQGVVPQSKNQWVLGFDRSPYGWRNDLQPGLRALQQRDYYLINLGSGERRLLARGLWVSMIETWDAIAPVISPDGTVVLYRDNQGAYFRYEIDSGERTNLSAGLPVRFFSQESRPQEGLQSSEPAATVDVVQGWTADGQYVLLSDQYDIWALPLHDRAPINLTRNGRQERIVYELKSLQASGAALVPQWRPLSSVDLEKPLFFKARFLKNGDIGVAQRIPGREDLSLLRTDAASIEYFRARKSDVVIAVRMTSVEGANYYRVDPSWRELTRLTDLYPQQREFAWFPPARYLEFKTSRGEISHAVLYSPGELTQAQQPYPTIVRIYEMQSGGIHAYLPPSDPVIRHWLEQGYAVLLPDIQSRLDEPGDAAVEAVTAAVDAAVATDVVDRERLGLIGFSFGAYETYYVLTHSKLFKAVVAEAGMTNLWSHYGSEWAAGIPQSVAADHNQPYVRTPWWDHWDATIRNSPLYHIRNVRSPLLIIHGDADTAIRFSQAVEMFNNLRRLGDRPVVLLQYVGADHGSIEFIPDAIRRKQQFFAHFLKGAAAPAWWAEEASYAQGTAPPP